MRINCKPSVYLLLIPVLFCCVYLISNVNEDSSLNSSSTFYHLKDSTPEYNVWCIFTKAVNRHVSIVSRFQHMLTSIYEKTSVQISLNLIVDGVSKRIAEEIVYSVSNSTGKTTLVRFYNVEEAVSTMKDLVNLLKPHFSPKAGTYYSDSLFFVSLGLDRIAPKSQDKVIMLDVDLQFQVDIKLLFNEFDNFNESNLIGAAPELSPVYHHLLYAYRKNFPGTRFGTPCCAPLPSPTVKSSNPESNKKSSSSSSANVKSLLTLEGIKGEPGVNSGVLLLRLDRIRGNEDYKRILSKASIDYLTKKYLFKGHLGDQDLYSLLSFERGDLVHSLGCGWNRQLCTWWRDHGYARDYLLFSHCPQNTWVYHANCKSNFPNKQQQPTTRGGQ